MTPEDTWTGALGVWAWMAGRNVTANSRMTESGGQIEDHDASELLNCRTEACA